jgi:hypothetical protein
VHRCGLQPEGKQQQPKTPDSQPAAMLATPFDLLAKHPLESRWKGTSLASAVHIHKLLAIYLVSSRWKESAYQRRACT